MTPICATTRDARRDRVITTESTSGNARRTIGSEMVIRTATVPTMFPIWRNASASQSAGRKANSATAEASTRKTSCIAPATAMSSTGTTAIHHRGTRLQGTQLVTTEIAASAPTAPRYSAESTSDVSDTASSRLMTVTKPVKNHCFATMPPDAEAKGPSHPVVAHCWIMDTMIAVRPARRASRASIGRLA